MSRRLTETDSVEGIEACVQCLCLMAERMNEIGAISDILDECLDTLEKAKKEAVFRRFAAVLAGRRKLEPEEEEQAVGATWRREA